MMRWGSVALLSGALLAALVGACSSGGASAPSGGGAGESAGPDGDAGPSCPSDGTGSLVIEVEGLPRGAEARVAIDGPTPTSAAGGSVTVGAGAYVATAARVYVEDPIVRTVYAATVDGPSFCIRDRESHTLQVSYAPIPSSNKLWMPSRRDPELVGFASESLRETATVDASVSLETRELVAFAFDRDGNLWGVSRDESDENLVRIPAAALGESGQREPDRSITVAGLTEVPSIHHLAFDPWGNLWLSASGDGLRRLNTATLVDSGEKTSDAQLTAVLDNAGIAFDGAGNLWVAGGPTLARFDAGRLDGPDPEPPDLRLSLTVADGSAALVATELAFDEAGNLWGVAGSTLFRLAPSELEGAGEKDVALELSFEIDAPEPPPTPAFDEGGGLWISFGEGSFGRYAPETLENVVSGRPVSPDVKLRSETTGAAPLAFFPAPRGLPLYHSLPSD